jgi:TetR/AcrR family transcriptional regulator, regulator of autoinduction and epiphytic fitness
MHPDADVLEAVDGRTARRDRNRTAVLDAVLELFAEHNVIPSAEDVARRSGVSLRSVYRYVENTDELILAAVERRREQVAPLFEIAGIGHGTLEDRIAALVGTRVHAYDEVAPTSRAARARAYSVPILRQQLDEASQQLRDQVAAQLSPELDGLAPSTREGILAAADALCQLETIELYRHQRGYSSDATTAMLTVALLRLLTEHPPDHSQDESAQREAHAHDMEGDR